ncbi:MAG: diguanylate cyclase [Candidatus Aminicenantales bacterium]
MKVLLAEDDVISCKILERNINKWGYEVAITQNGKEAWKALQNHSLRLAIVDWMMPEMDGVELCQKIRQAQKPKYTYIILLTARDNQQDIIEGLQAGADDYMTKPVNFLELKARLQTGRRIIELEDKLLESQGKLYELATQDSLTGLWNRATIMQFLQEELEHSSREDYAVSIILLDIDFFKKINDTHGHHTGDLVLKKATSCLKKHVRPYDRIGRYGGDEMLIVLPHCSKKNVARIAERLRYQCSKANVRTTKGPLSLTLSLGCASSEDFVHPTVHSLILAGDNALYKAKNQGRNCVAISEIISKPKKGRSNGTEANRKQPHSY